MPALQHGMITLNIKNPVRSNNGRAGRHVPSHDGVGANARAIADGDGPHQFRARTNEHPVTYMRRCMVILELVGPDGYLL